MPSFVKHALLLLVLSLAALAANAQVTPPFAGTIFIDSSLVTACDPSVYESSVYVGQGSRTVFDRRVNNWVTINGYLFDVMWADGLSTEAIVNPEFGSEAAAQVEAEKYGWLTGQLPYALRVDVDELWIHQGVELYGGGNNSILIHTGQSANYEADGIIEETLIHEACHTSLDAAHAGASGWQQAQVQDPGFISTYAEDNPTTEDVAESFLTWLAIRYFEHRISTQHTSSIVGTIPNRIAYFDAQQFNLSPLIGAFVDTVVACEPYTWIDGTNYTASNSTATHLLTAANGCDSIVRLELHMDEVEAGVTQNNHILQADEPGASYQWLDCDNNNAPIVGATMQQFTATANGNYAVEVSKLTCTETSDCIEVTSVGLQQLSAASEMILHPNPAQSGQSVVLEQVPAGATVIVRNSLGQLVPQARSARHHANVCTLQVLAPGVYFVEVQAKSFRTVHRLIVQ